jgi:translation initiation factor IF-2
MTKKKSESETNRKLPIVNEPQSVYESMMSTNSSSLEELSEELKQILSIGVKQSELGQTTPHEVVMAEIKKKYNFS